MSSLKSRAIQDLQALFGASKVRIAYGYETKYKRLQVLDLHKSHTNDAVAIACQLGEVVKPLETVHHIRCLGRGQYQRFNGQGAFVIKAVAGGKKLAEVVPRTLVRIARPTQGWSITRQPAPVTQQ